MPASRPRASFEPIPPDFDLRALVEATESFQYVDRISSEMIREQGMEQFEKLVLLHVIIGGKPLVIDGFDESLDPWTFTPRWLKDNHGSKVENARNLANKHNLPLTIGHYLKNMGLLCDQFFANDTNYKDKKRQRIYLKDIDCPAVWHDKVREVIPASLFYLNDSTGEVGGLGAEDDLTQPAGGRRKGRGVGPAGDLMSSLPEDMRAENLMCYIGHEGTYTPSHREMCASLGQNIMVEASGTVGEDGRPEKPGSSIWFMTETKHRHLVAEYWQSVLGHDIEVENHFAQVQAWVHAPFTTYVVEQRPGDFILIPPLAPHQVWNRGTRTTKVAWNRTTVETLEMAMAEALPNARLVCRDEQYKNKAIIYFTLQKYANILKGIKAQCEASPAIAYEYAGSTKTRQLKKAFKRLFELYKQILLSESFADGTKEHPEFLPFDSNVTCAYCRGNIFNRFLTCKSCTKALGTETEEPYDVCMDCFAMGRSCACTSDLKWTEQWRWKDLMFRYEEWRQMIIEIDGGLTEKTPQTLQEERRYYGKKTLASICQSELRTRPWVDWKNPKPPEQSDEETEIVVNDDGTVKKAIKKHSKTYLLNNKRCHVCLHHHPKWKMAHCTLCDNWWCYGTLWRAHDLMPQTVMEDVRWQCPHCKKQCNTGRCRHDPRQKPYEPKGTLLGHDTKKVADVRSVEALVDFGVSNLNWIRGTGDDPLDSMQFQNRRAEAEQATEIEEYEDEHGIVFTNAEGDDAIDPALRGPTDAQPATTAGASAPVEVHNQDGEGEPDSPNHYPVRDPNGPHVDEFEDGSTIYREPEDGASNKKRKRQPLPFKLAKSTPRPPRKKKKKGEDDQEEEPTPVPVNVASKNFKKQQEKQLLEEARQQNRYVIVYASLKERKKLVTLNLDSDVLASEEARVRRRRQSLGGHHTGLDGTYNGNGTAAPILQSDVGVSRPSANLGPNGKTKPARELTRARVEEDDDFRSRKRADRPTKRSRHKDISARWEDIEVSDEEDFAEEYAPQPSRRRRGSEGLLELPENFKDGQVSASRRQTLPSGASLRPPPSHQVKGSNGKFVSKAYLRAQNEAAQELARQAAAVVEAENRNAKLQALDVLDGDDDENLFSSGNEQDAPGEEDDVDAQLASQLGVGSGFTPVNAKTVDMINGGAGANSGSVKGRGAVPTRGKTTPSRERGRGRAPKLSM